MSDGITIIFFIRYLDFDAVNEYLTTRKGLLGTAMTLGAFVPTTEESKRDDWPEVQIHLVPHLVTDFDGYRNIFSISDDYWDNYLMKEFKGKHGVTLSYCLLRPKSR